MTVFIYVLKVPRSSRIMTGTEQDGRIIAGKDGQKHAKKAYTVKNPIYLTISGSYRAYNVDKPGNVTVKVQETGIKASLTFLF